MRIWRLSKSSTDEETAKGSWQTHWLRTNLNQTSGAFLTPAFDCIYGKSKGLTRLWADRPNEFKETMGRQADWVLRDDGHMGRLGVERS